MDEYRPSPEVLLQQISKIKPTYGKLKVFFGYAAGVGKTYAMLEAAHIAKNAGIDVVAGYVEPHSRPETSQLLEELEILPLLKIKRQDLILNEFDIDGALKRHPTLMLVDELAHTNAKGCRNLKRYQDIEELLKAGINVYTTVNIQHIESLNDMVHQITKIVVSERIPDRVLDEAEQIEVIDIEPEELIARLNSGKIYKTEQARRALENFFTIENLVALREIALRRTADQINKKIEQTKMSLNYGYYTNEHILICISSSPSNAKVIRAASRMATAFHGSFTALFVETCSMKDLPPDDLARLRANLKLAEQLGAKLVTVYGEDVPMQIADYAKVAGVSKIIIGRSNNKKTLFSKQNFIERLSQIAPNLDMYVIPDQLPPYSKRRNAKQLRLPTLTVPDVIKTICILSLMTFLGFCFDYLGYNEANIITLYILGVLAIAISTEGKLYCCISALLSVLMFNFCFTTPRYSLQTTDQLYPITFFIIFVSAILTNTLATRVKEQSYQSALKAKNIEVLLETSRLLQNSSTKNEIYFIMGEQLFKLLNHTIIIYPTSQLTLLDKPITFLSPSDNSPDLYLTSNEHAVAEWVFRNNKNAGATTHTLSGAKCLYLAVRGKTTILSVVAIALNTDSLDHSTRNLLITMLDIFGIALENKESTL